MPYEGCCNGGTAAGFGRVTLEATVLHFLFSEAFFGLDGDALRWLAAVLEGEVGWGDPW